MSITLKNKELVPTINFLQSLSLRPADSRQRSKFVKELSKALESYSEEEKALLKDLNLLDENDEILDVEKQDKDSVKIFNAEQVKLMDEEVVITGGIHEKNIAKIPKILNNLEIELSGIDAEIYDRLLDEFDKADEQIEETK